MGLYKAKPRLVDLYTLDNTVLSTLSIPDDLDAGVCRAMILQECGGLETVFESAAELKAYLTPWSAAHAEPWQRMLSALAVEYNPIHNYDRTDTETINDVENSTTESSVDHTGSETAETLDNTTTTIDRTDTDEYVEHTRNVVDGKVTETKNGASTSAEEESITGSATTEESGTNTAASNTSVAKADTSTIKKMGFDSQTFVDSDQTVVSATETGTSNTSGTSARDVQTDTTSDTTRQGSTTNSELSVTKDETETTGQREIDDEKNVDSTEIYSADGTRTTSNSAHDVGDSETNREAERIRELRSSGNIGVTTAQQMITAEVDMRIKFNIYNIIVRAFRADLCVGVF